MIETPSPYPHIVTVIASNKEFNDVLTSHLKNAFSKYKTEYLFFAGIEQFQSAICVDNSILNHRIFLDVTMPDYKSKCFLEVIDPILRQGNPAVYLFSPKPNDPKLFASLSRVKFSQYFTFPITTRPNDLTQQRLYHPFSDYE